MALIDKLTAIADAIRGKTGKTDEMTLDQMVTEIAGIQTGGGGDSEELVALFNKTLTTIPNSLKELEAIPDRALYMCTKLEEIDFPNAVTVGENAFGTIRNVKMTYKRVNLPKVKTVGSSAFSTYNDDAEFDVYLPEATTISKSFTMGWGIQYVILPKIANIPYQSFHECKDAKLILPQSSIVTLANSAYFPNTFAFYVPKNMQEQYAQETNWSVIAAEGKLYAIEDSEDVLAKLSEVGYEYTPTTGGE